MKTKQEQLLKEVRKQKRFVKKVTKSKQSKEKSFALRRLSEKGIRRIKGRAIQTLDYDRIKIAYQTHFNESLTLAYLNIHRGKTVPNKNEFVYFIGSREFGFVKIGYSKNPKQRLKQIQTSVPFPVEILKAENGNKETETRYHLRFQKHNTYGEWFQIKEMLMVHLHEF